MLSRSPERVGLFCVIMNRVPGIQNCDES